MDEDNGMRLAALERAMFGDDKMGEPGMVSDVRDIKKTMTSLNVGLRTLAFVGSGVIALVLLVKTGDWSALKALFSSP